MQDTKDCPVLFLAYNRPDLTLRTFDAIRGAAPKSLFVALDGPKNDDIDRSLCEDVRKIVQDVNWLCDVKYLSRANNLGCKLAVEEAINWFFSQVQYGAIIEDDCLIDKSFLTFASDLLQKYKFDTRISMISGFSFINDTSFGSSYVTSNLSTVWGWATWANSWRNYNSDMNDWSPEVLERNASSYGSMLPQQMNILKKEYLSPSGRTWGVQWRYCNLISGKVSIVPTRSMIQNIGLGHPSATKLKGFHPLGLRPPLTIETPIIHPDSLEVAPFHDERSLESYYSGFSNDNR